MQRQLSLEKNLETAIVLDYPYPWDIGAPLPQVISDGNQTFLFYYVGEKKKRWESFSEEVIDLGGSSQSLLALVTFEYCYAHKLEGINDEVIEAHPLFSHGLEAYELHKIENSVWVTQQMKTHSIHSNFSEESWNLRNHYVFTFHDEIFECIANGFQVEVFRGSRKALFLEIAKRMFS